jgi:hypothetical protein
MMNPTTLKALKQSIAHWKRLSTGKRREGETVGAAHCALCDLFLNDGCSKCPVAQKVQRSGCSLTPYNDACDAHNAHGIDSPEFKSAAKVELEFLQSLLPKQRTKKSK